MKLLNPYMCIGVFSLFLLAIGGCSNTTGKQELAGSTPSENSITEELPAEDHRTNTNVSPTDTLPEKPTSIEDFLIPEGYSVFDHIQGDLNGDGLDDYVIIIKGTIKENIIQDEYRGALDRNRRGILIYFSNKGKFVLITRNLDCFSSENEDGGAYFPPELNIEIENGKLYIHYAHGRYGYWKYTFRSKKSDFELIGFDSSANYGPIIQRETSINFLTKKKLIRENVNEQTEEGGDEIFEETWETIEIEKLLRLSEINDFDFLEL